MTKREKLSTESYKGGRDFYPEDQFIQRYLFEHMERVCELFGYEEYNASILEPAELYRSKTSEEIVNEQTYTFTDRGAREVTLRPEMTPTFARMVAARQRDIPLPARWYSIPNVFRYERPQRGRLREHWPLDAIYHSVGIAKEYTGSVTRLLDRRAKIDDFEKELTTLIAHEEKAVKLIEELENITSTAYLEELRVALERLGVRNMVVDTSITRGFDYYTGMIFEVFDTDETNRRSLFGGGRYDNLLSLFGGEPIPAVGFAMGDVTARDFLEAHNLMPEYAPATEVMICIVEPEATSHAVQLAQGLRREDVTTAVNFSGKRIGDQIRSADKMKIPFIVAVGAKERDSGRYTVKNLSTGGEITLPADRIAEHLFSSLG